MTLSRGNAEDLLYIGNIFYILPEICEAAITSAAPLANIDCVCYILGSWGLLTVEEHRNLASLDFNWIILFQRPVSLVESRGRVLLFQVLCVENAHHEIEKRKCSIRWTGRDNNILIHTTVTEAQHFRRMQNKVCSRPLEEPTRSLLWMTPCPYSRLASQNRLWASHCFSVHFLSCSPVTLLASLVSQMSASAYKESTENFWLWWAAVIEISQIRTACNFLSVVCMDGHYTLCDWMIWKCDDSLYYSQRKKN